MILVDTSVIIQFLRGDDNDKVELFKSLIIDNQPFGISVYTYSEVLQGARDEMEYQTLDRYLGSQVIYRHDTSIETYKDAATLYYRLRKQGVSLRGLVDVLIALTAIQNNLTLLHNDRDFEYMKRVESSLRTL